MPYVEEAFPLGVLELYGTWNSAIRGSLRCGLAIRCLGELLRPAASAPRPFLLIWGGEGLIPQQLLQPRERVLHYLVYISYLLAVNLCRKVLQDWFFLRLGTTWRGQLVPMPLWGVFARHLLGRGSVSSATFNIFVCHPRLASCASASWLPVPVGKVRGGRLLPSTEDQLLCPGGFTAGKKKEGVTRREQRKIHERHFLSLLALAEESGSETEPPPFWERPTFSMRAFLAPRDRDLTSY